MPSPSEPTRDDDGRSAAKRRELGVQMAALGLEFSSSVIGGLILGYLLDRWLGTEPWLFLLGTFGGMGAAVARIVQLTRRFERLAAQRKRDDGGS